MWRLGTGEPSREFLDVVVEELSDDDEMDIDEVDEVDMDEHEIFGDCRQILSSSPGPSIPRHSVSSYRDRSRSPLCNELPPDWEWTEEVVQPECNDCEGQAVDSKEFLAPDAHPLFIVDECNERVGVRVRRRVNRGGPSGAMRVRGRGRRGTAVGGRGRGVNSWQVGDPLQVVWAHDDDVPPELRQMVMDVMRKREERAQDERRKRLHERNVLDEEKDSESADDGFQDAIGGSNNSLQGDSLRFKWYPMDTFQSAEEPFTPMRTGSVGVYSTPYEAFRSCWDHDILNLIVDRTNLYASNINAATFQMNWYPTNVHEILCLFAFWMMLGIIRMPTIKSCFSTDPLLNTSVFRKMFTQRRYDDLTRALHFVATNPANTASTSTNDSASLDRLHLLRPVIDHLNDKFQSNYVLSKDICIDERLTLWKGMLDMKQNIQSKGAKFGVKSYELCESATGYLWSFIYYTGSDPDLPSNPSKLSTTIVRKLIDPLLNKGYRLFLDNRYNSPLLARFLKRNGTDCVGILCPSRSDVPPIINQAKLKQGQFVARHSGDVCVMAWQDKNRVTTISTCHGADTGLSRVLSNSPSRPLAFKPQIILDYNRSMGGLDLKDQTLEPYLLERKRCGKWYMKLFRRLLNCSILNARILLSSSTQRQHDHLNFRCRLVDAILTNHLLLCPRVRRDIPVEESASAQGTHWPVNIAQTAADATRNKQTRKRCKVCLDRKDQRRTPYECETCKVPLCAVGCFKFYHDGR